MSNVLILTYWSYQDALVQTYTLPYVRIIKKYLPSQSKIFLTTFEQPQLNLTEKQKKIEKENLLKEKIHWLDFNYSRFGFFAVLKFFFSFLSLLFICWRKKFTTIHCWCTPAGAMGYLLSKLTGIPLIIDSYEPHAEAMVENGTWKENSFAFKLLFYFEKKMSHHAAVLIAASSRMGKYAEEKYNLKNKKIYVKPAFVDLEQFSPKYIKNEILLMELGLTDKIVCVYAGKFGGIYLEKEVFNFLKVAYDYWKVKLHILLLPPAPEDKIHALAKQAGLNPKIITLKFISHKDIPLYLGLADFAINPVKPVPSKKYCTSMKDGEYWAMGLPVVITKDISDDSKIIEENDIGAVLYNLDKENYLAAIKKIDAMLSSSSLPEKKNEIRNIAKKFRRFEVAEKIYQEIYS